MVDKKFDLIGANGKNNREWEIENVLSFLDNTTQHSKFLSFYLNCFVVFNSPTAAKLRVSFDAHQAIVEQQLDDARIELMLLVHLADERQNLFSCELSNCLNRDNVELSDN